MNRQLLFSLTRKDFDIQFFRCGSSGGQHRDKTSNGVRIKHRASGVIGESTESRSQAENKKKAFRRLTECKDFKWWHKLETARLMGLIKTHAEIENDIRKELEDPEITEIECYTPK